VIASARAGTVLVHGTIATLLYADATLFIAEMFPFTYDSPNKIASRRSRADILAGEIFIAW
jgi:hypothetical protein